MTTSGPARKPPGRHAAAGSGRVAAQPPDDDTAPATSDTGPPDDVQELQLEIEQTREHLGETVEQLVAKTDVKARAQDKAAELTGRAKGKTSQVVAQGASTARQRRVPLAVAAGVLMVGYLIIRWRRRR